MLGCEVAVSGGQGSILELIGQARVWPLVHCPGGLLRDMTLTFLMNDALPAHVTACVADGVVLFGLLQHAGALVTIHRPGGFLS